MFSRGLPLHSRVKADKPEVILEAKPWLSGLKWLGKTTSVAVPTVTLRRQGRGIAPRASLSRSRWTPSIVRVWGLLTGAAVISGTLPFQRGNNLDLGFNCRNISKVSFLPGLVLCRDPYKLAIFPILQRRKTALSRVTLLCLGLWIHSPCFSHLPTGSQSGYSGTGEGHQWRGTTLRRRLVSVWWSLRDRITCSPDWSPTSTVEYPGITWNSNPLLLPL